MEFLHTKLSHDTEKKKKSWNKTRSNNSFLMHPVKKKIELLLWHKRELLYWTTPVPIKPGLQRITRWVIHSTIDICQAGVTKQFNELKHYWHATQFVMQHNLAHSFCPLKTTALNHRELNQQEGRVSFNSSFGIKDVSCDSNFIHCM